MKKRYGPFRQRKCNQFFMRYFVHKKLRLCADYLEEVFEIPKGIEKIWITIHERPAADRVRVTGKKGCSFYEVDGVEYLFLDEIQQEMKCPFYAGVEYEE